MNEEIIEETGKPKKRFRWGLFFLGPDHPRGDRRFRRTIFIYLPYTESMAEYQAALDAETRARR